ncbi:hypothetical protein DV515_00011125 [Chloebia gouldiae]|uniref:Uncharacterized protein n=1 Tax=Chloebia gouldiae TaxID=44316 RepID=A0A3L8S7D2_CHLGU|nr:hypothetical protein DV515_00011125 [Chloebia gouldiae]
MLWVNSFLALLWIQQAETSLLPAKLRRQGQCSAAGGELGFGLNLDLYKLLCHWLRVKALKGPLNISNKQVRMFQTVPDTSSYVKEGVPQSVTGCGQLELGEEGNAPGCSVCKEEKEAL